MATQTIYCALCTQPILWTQDQAEKSACSKHKTHESCLRVLGNDIALQRAYGDFIGASPGVTCVVCALEVGTNRTNSKITGLRDLFSKTLSTNSSSASAASSSASSQPIPQPSSVQSSDFQKRMEALKVKAREGDSDAMNDLFNESPDLKGLIAFGEELIASEGKSEYYKCEVALRLAELYVTQSEIRDIKKSEEWFKRAKSVHDDGLAGEIAFLIGEAYEDEDHGQNISSEEAYRKAFEWYNEARKPRDCNQAKMFNKLADCYRYGIGTEVNLEEAIDWYKIALEDIDDCEEAISDQEELKELKKMRNYAENTLIDLGIDPSEIEPEES